VQATSISAIASVVPVYGVRISLSSANSGLIYWGIGSSVTTSTGCLLPAGSTTTINRADFGGDLSTLYFIASASSQTLTGAAL
jgi:hypothetical protein